MEASARFEHEEGSYLLDEQTDDYGPPLDSGPVLRGRPETKLEHDETQNGDGAIAIFRSLKGSKGNELRISKWGSCWCRAQSTHFFELEAKSRAENDCDNGEPAQSEAYVFWDTEERLLYMRDPYCLDWAGHSVGYKTEGDYEDEGPGENGLYDPSVACCMKDGGGDPPTENEKGKTDKAHDTNEAAAAG